MKVEIWSDMSCNFCYVAKRKFESALSQFKDRDKIEIVWKSFEIAPQLKTDPNKFFPQFLSELKGMSMEQAQGIIDQVSNSVKELGLEFNMNKTIPANSFNAHRLSHLAKDHDLQDKAKEILLKAYFTDGKNIDDIPTLIQLGKEIGLDASEVKSMLEGIKYSDEVLSDITKARMKGITSVPHYLFDDKASISGAQDTRVFLETLEKSFAQWEAENPEKKTEVMNGQTCSVGESCM